MAAYLLNKPAAFQQATCEFLLHFQVENQGNHIDLSSIRTTCCRNNSGVCLIARPLPVENSSFFRWTAMYFHAKYQLTSLEMLETKLSAGYLNLKLATESEIGCLCQGSVQPAHHGFSRLSHTPNLFNQILSTVKYYCGVHDALQLADLMRFLVNSGTCPFETLRSRSIHRICLTWRKGPETHETWTHYPLSSCLTDCRACKTSLKDILKGITDKVSHSVVGLCIQCVRMGEDQEEILMIVWRVDLKKEIRFASGLR